MAEIKITLKGDKKLIKRLLNKSVIQKELQKAGTKAGAIVQQRAMKYPPQRPGSWYVRTNRLMHSWAFKVKPYTGGVRTFVTNPTEYGPDVMDAKEQASVHQGRWITTRGILKEKRRQIVGFFEEARDIIIKRLRG